MWFPERKNTLNKLTNPIIFRWVILGLILLSAAIGLGEGNSTLAAPQEPQATDYVMPVFSYRFVAGSSLHSADYSMRQVYQPGSCISVLDTGIEFLNVGLQLPDGARIDYLRLFYYDSNAGTNGTANIRKYDGSGGYVEIASVSSAGSAGFGTTLSSFANHVVDNGNGGYVLNWEPFATGTSIQLCGLRVAYRLDAVPIYIPYVRR